VKSKRQLDPNTSRQNVWVGTDGFANGCGTYLCGCIPFVCVELWIRIVCVSSWCTQYRPVWPLVTSYRQFGKLDHPRLVAICNANQVRFVLCFTRCTVHRHRIYRVLKAIAAFTTKNRVEGASGSIPPKTAVTLMVQSEYQCNRGTSRSCLRAWSFPMNITLPSVLFPIAVFGVRHSFRDSTLQDFVQLPAAAGQQNQTTGGDQGNSRN
jgi:hypothetical protein